MVDFPGGRIQLRERAAPATPPSGDVVLYSVDGSALLMKDDAGNVTTLGGGTAISGLSAAGTLADADVLPIVNGGATKKVDLTALTAYFEQRGRQNNASVALQTIAGNTDTYVTGSDVSIPAGRLQAKSQYRVRFQMVKTAAGTATPILTVRIGTAGTTADGARGVHTFAAQTGVADEGQIDLNAVFRTVGSGTSAVLQSMALLDHRLAATGLSTANSSATIATSAGFDSTTAGLKIGLSLNVGASGSWAINLVAAELFNLA